ncbi:MAG TPA: amidohydrolase family protein [Pyrinomonadaceae bacterium]|nr:amidohydrolase family protein [Pyrinomonadaceae bacterium]
MPVIDAHTHTDFSGGPERTSGIAKTEAQYFKEWREAGIVGAVAHTSPIGANFHDLKNRNVVYCAGVGLTIDDAAIEAGLKSGKYGCIKVYLGYVHRFAYDPAYNALYRLAEKYDVPVVYHTGDTYSARAKVKYADPLTIDEVAVDHPRVKFVIAHCGNPWIESAAEVTYKNANVFMECSAMLIGNLDQMAPEKVETYVTKPIAWIFGYLEDPRKLMFGTDWPLTSMKPYLEAYKKAIPQEHWKAVFHDNAVRVFKFPGWKDLK